MNFFCRTGLNKTSAFLPQLNRSCVLSIVAVCGLLLGTSNFLAAATSTTTLQEEDQDVEKNVDVQVLVVGADDKEIDEKLKSLNIEVDEAISKSDGEGKVIVIRADGTDNLELQEKLKAHNIELHEILSDKQGKDAARKIIRIHADGVDDPELKDKLKAHNVELHEILSENQGTDGTPKVIRMRIDGDDHAELHEKLKAHNVELHELLSGEHGEHGQIKVIQIQDEDNKASDKALLHRHLIELAHGPSGHKVDHRALAKQLRKIADQLDGGVAKKQLRLNQPKADVHQNGEIRLRFQKQGDQEMSDKPTAKWVTDSGQRIVLQKPDAPKKIKIEAKAESHQPHPAHGEGHENLFVLKQPQDGQPNIIVKRAHSSGSHDEQVEEVEELRFGNAKSSSEGMDGAIKELKNELQQLRQELNQLRSQQRTPPKARNRQSDENKVGNRKPNPAVAGRVMERSRTNVAGKPRGADKELFWVQEDDAKAQSGNRFFLKQESEKTESSKPGVFRFEFRSKNSDEDDQGV